MSKAAELKKAIQILAGTYDKDIISIEVCVVNSVDTTNWLCTATPTSGEAPTQITDIMMSAEQASNGFVLVPVVGSTIIVAITLRNDVYVLMTSEVDQVIYYRDNGDGTFHSFVWNANGFQEGDGSYGGMIKLLDSNIQYGLLARLNAIESFISTLQTAINGWVPVPNDGGAALKTALAAWLGSTAPSTTRPMIENPDFTHGKKLT